MRPPPPEPIDWELEYTRDIPPASIFYIPAILGVITLLAIIVATA